MCHVVYCTGVWATVLTLASCFVSLKAGSQDEPVHPQPPVYSLSSLVHPEVLCL